MKPSRTFPLVATLFGVGCYTYQPAPPLPPTGTTVRVDLVDRGAPPPSAALMGPGAMHVEGVVRRADDSTLTLAVAEVQRRTGDPERWNGETVSLARSEIAQLSIRSFSAPRTGLAALVAVAGALVAARAFQGGGEGATGVITPPAPGH